MIIESNGGGSTGAAEHGQMIFSSAGNISGSINVMKIERSDVSDDSTPTLQLQRPLRLWNATTANITNVTTGLTQVGDMAFDTDEDVIKYRGNGGIRTIGGGLTAETIGPLNFYYLTSGSSGTWSALSPIYLLNYPATFSVIWYTISIARECAGCIGGGRWMSSIMQHRTCWWYYKIYYNMCIRIQR